MSVSTANQVVTEIDAYIRQGGGGYSAWYVGIASEPRQRLFDDHNVDKDRDAWIYRDCGSQVVARQVEVYFLQRGCQGGGGGGDSSTHYAYAYKMNAHTNP